MPPLGAAAPSRSRLVWDPGADSYLFETDVAQYRLVIGPADEQSGLLYVEGRLGSGVEDRPWQPLLRGAGMLLREEEGNILPASATHQRAELIDLQHYARGKVLNLRYTELLEKRALSRSLEIRQNGRSLEIVIDALGGKPLEGFCGFSSGTLGPDDATTVQVPGLPDPLLRCGEDSFLAVYPERYLGGASAYPPGAAFYRANGEGVSAPVRETFYVTLSPDPLDPLPALRRPAAPHRALLQNRIALDFYSEASYAEDEQILGLLHHYGLHDLVLIYRNWQQYGYEQRDPLLYPANPARGDNEAFRKMLARADANGWLVALREEYATVATDSPYWTEAVLARWEDGQPRIGRGGSHAISADRMLEFARLEATKIQRNYPASAVFVDGHTAWNPEGCYRQVDAARGPTSEAAAVRHVETLLDFLRDVHEGPVIGASGSGPVRFDTFAEGMAEAVIRGVEDGQRGSMLADYELREVRPKLLSFGAGTYRQFCALASGEPVDISQIDTDAYRATEVALGHAGYVGNYRVKPGPRGPAFPGGASVAAVREYYLLRALQELSLSAPVREIRYRDGEELLELRDALRRGLDLSQAQLRIEYGGGLTVWVNRSEHERWQLQADDKQWDLPPYGFLASAPSQEFLAYSALISGQRADFCRSTGYTFLDARSPNPRTVEGMTTDGSVALLASEVPNRPDVVLVGARQLKLGKEEYYLSERGDVRFRHLSPDELEIVVLDSGSGKPLHISWPAYTWSWKSANLEVLELEDGEWRASRCNVIQVRTGPQLTRALPGSSYRIITSGR
jgi:hypothetical protein